MRNIGKIIQLRLDEMNMTQSQLGKKIGASQQTISLIINNRRTPSIEMLIQICDILEINLDFLLDYNSYDNSSFIISDINEKEIIECYRSLNKEEKRIFNAFISAIKTK